MLKTTTFFLCIILFSLYSCNMQQTTNLKLMSYNIHHGEGMDTVLDLSRTVRIVKSFSPDLVGLQEVDHFCLRTDSIDQTEHLAQETAMKGTFGKFMGFQGGEYGMATLTGIPMISTSVLKLPDGKYEPRSSIIHEVKLAQDCIIAFANVHFDWIDGKEGSTNRLNQAKVLVKYLDSLRRATVIIGDFNCTPDSPTMRYFNSQGFVFVQKEEDNLSFQGSSKSEIDHVIYRNTDDIQFKEKSIQLLNEPIASDHRPLVAELEVEYK